MDCLRANLDSIKQQEPEPMNTDTTLYLYSVVFCSICIHCRNSQACKPAGNGDNDNKQLGEKYNGPSKAARPRLHFITLSDVL